MKPETKRALIKELREQWAITFPNEPVFFGIGSTYPTNYSPRYRGKRDYSTSHQVFIHHNMEDSYHKIEQFVKLFRKYPVAFRWWGTPLKSKGL
jgi:hypothetical protein